MTLADSDIFNQSAGYFQTDGHCALIANGVRNHLEKTRGVALVTGGPGTLQALLRNLNALVDAIHIRCQGEITFAAILEAYVNSLGLRATAGDNTGKWPRLAPSAALSGRSRLLALENAQLLSAEALAELFSVPSIADPGRPPILLTAADEIRERLTHISGDLLGSTIFAHFRGECLAEAEVGPFIDFQHGRGNTAAGDVFRPEIVDLIAAFADGDPAVVNSLAVGILEAVRGATQAHDEAGDGNVDLAREEGASSGVPARNGAAVVAENVGGPPDQASFEGPSGTIGPLPVLEAAQAIKGEHKAPTTAKVVRDRTPVVAEAPENSQAITALPAAGSSTPSPDADGDSRSDIGTSVAVLETPTAGLVDSPKSVSAERPRRRTRPALRWLAAGAALGMVSAGAILHRLGPAPVGAEPGEDRPAQPVEVLPSAVAQPLDQLDKPTPPVADATTEANPMPALHQPAILVPSSGTSLAQPTSAQGASEGMPGPAAGDAMASPVAPATEPASTAAPAGAAIPTEQLAATIDPTPAARAADAPQSIAKADPSAAAANAASQGEAGPLVRRGDQLMSIGDIASARSFFERAAAKDESVVATRIAKTYDPLFLEQSGVHGGLGNAGKAMAWYRKGIAAGDLEAVVRFQLLRNKYPE